MASPHGPAETEPSEVSSVGPGDARAYSKEPPLSSELQCCVDRSKVPAYLEPYGYTATDSVEWFGPTVPELSIRVTGHAKSGGQTYYDVECALAKPGQWHSPYLTWRTSRRLVHLRSALHDPVKRELGSKYRTLFSGVHFAHSYGPSGTTARLDAWCRKLAQLITSKQVGPYIVAVAFQLLGAPDADASLAARSESEGNLGDVREGDMAALPKSATSPPLPEPEDDPHTGLNPFSSDLPTGEWDEAPVQPPPRFSGAPLDLSPKALGKANSPNGPGPEDPCAAGGSAETDSEGETYEA